MREGLLGLLDLDLSELIEVWPSFEVGWYLVVTPAGLGASAPACGPHGAFEREKRERPLKVPD